MRNPINGLVGCLRLAAPLLEELTGSSDQLEATNAITQLKSAIVDATLCSDVCLLTLANMTSLQRLEAGLLDPVRQPTRLPDTISKVAAIIRPQLQPGVKCVATIGGAHLTLSTNPRMLVQILTNLAQNAAKHTKAGFVELHASVTHTATEGLINLELAVRDSGPGLSEESKLTCFNKYTTTSGVGLGLYLTKLQVELLGGTITVKSPWSPDHPGSAFCVMLPMCAASASLAPAPVVPPTPEFHAGVRVLVADDVRINRALLSRAFTRRFGSDWAVQEVTTAEEALSALCLGHGFELVVMDEIFSDIDDNLMRGSAAIRLLREREKAGGLPRVAVISCTGNASHECSHLLARGADRVWNKPFPNAEDGEMQRDIAMLLPHRVRVDTGAALYEKTGRA